MRPELACFGGKKCRKKGIDFGRNKNVCLTGHFSVKNIRDSCDTNTNRTANWKKQHFIVSNFLYGRKTKQTTYIFVLIRKLDIASNISLLAPNYIHNRTLKKAPKKCVHNGTRWSSEQATQTMYAAHTCVCKSLFMVILKHKRAYVYIDQVYCCLSVDTYQNNSVFSILHPHAWHMFQELSIYIFLFVLFE